MPCVMCSVFLLSPITVVDPVLTKKGSDVTYKVKALEGEQWLKKKDAAIDSQTYTKTAADLPAFSTIIDVVTNNTMLGEATVNPDFNWCVYRRRAHCSMTVSLL